MRQYLIISVIVILITLSKVSSEISECIGNCKNSETPYLPHKICTKFCVCNHGRPTEMSCPADLHFSPENHVCMNPWEAECQEDRSLIKNNNQNKGVDAISQSQSSCVGKCDSSINYLPHLDSDKFCLCYSGNPIVMKCQSGANFIPEMSSCLQPNEVKDHREVNSESCIGTCPANMQPDVIYLLPHKNCNKYCLCIQGYDRIIHSCPPELLFSWPEKKCLQPEIARCADSDYNATYFQGRPIEVSCPEGLHFSSKKFDCMDPTDAQCQEEDYSSRGCIGECFCEDPNKVCLLAHENCNKFCLCRCAKNTEVQNCPEVLIFGLTCASAMESVSLREFNLFDETKPMDPSKCIGKCSWPSRTFFSMLPHEDCNKFCKCVFGHLFTKKCPRNKHWSVELRRCVLPKFAKCAEKRMGCIGKCPAENWPQAVHVLPNADCRKFCICENGNAQVKDCPYGFKYSITHGICYPPNEAVCVSDATTTTSSTPSSIPDNTHHTCIGTCSKNPEDFEYLAHGDCTKYCICIGGNPTEMECNYNFHFSMDIHECVTPAEADCKSRLIFSY
ncbi:balbiani ring protein 3-like [Microplitis mediator]|uniref:balbiani ring protein 3-like n=1 Tax=Microplitis mediator TaxID=375433 RepID=UPI0025546C4C|nr:balbiani ring protein 3-like [Microplitis mediator]